MDQNSEEFAEPVDTANPDLVGWVMEKVQQWRTSRDAKFATNWAQYYKLWKCEWSPDLKNKNAERSRLVAPATQNAVDQTVAEMAEAVFGRGKYIEIDLPDDAPPDQLAAAEMTRSSLIDDFDRDKVQGEILKVFVNGAIYGTGIAKRTISTRDDKSPSVTWEAVAPSDFVIDTAACGIDDALGCAHETILPQHIVTDKQGTGEYNEGDIGGRSNQIRSGPDDQDLQLNVTDGVDITEYHGKVPTKYLRPSKGGTTDSEYLDQPQDDTEDDDSYTECVVTIANGNMLLKYMENPFGVSDRGMVAYQHFTNPNNFWGIGVVEKAYNSQMGLDAELRARIDALALLTYPVVGADATRLPKNLNLTVMPGKIYMTNGRASEIIEPLKFGVFDPVSFQQSADFERMVQMATGASDPATPANIDRKNGTSSGMSMQTGSFIKRAKLTMQNVDVYFLDPLVTKTVSAYVYLDPQRYPLHTKFVVNSTMSIMAREFEQMQMTNLLAIIPQNSPAFQIVLKSIVANYSGPSKDKVLAAIDAAAQPDPQAQQMQQQLHQMAIAKAQKELQLLDAQIAKEMAEAGLTGAKTKTEAVKPQIEMTHAEIAKAQTEVSARQVGVSEKQLQVQAAKEHLGAHATHMQLLHDQKTKDSESSNQTTLAQGVAALAKSVAEGHKAAAEKKPKTRKGKATLPSGGTMTFEVTDG